MSNSFRSKVALFWKAFSEDEKTIREMMDKNVESETLINFTESILKTAFVDVHFHMGMSLDNKYELILTPQGDRVKLIQLHYWLQCAPVELQEEWNFYASQPALSDTEFEVEMFGVTLKEEDLIIYPNVNNTNSKIELDIFCPKLDTLPDSQRYSIFFIFLDQYIGELYTIQHVSDIQFTNDELHKKQIKIKDLKKHIDKVITQNGWLNVNNPLDEYLGYKVKQTEKTDWRLREDIAAGYSSCTAPISAYHFKDDSFFEKYYQDGIVFGFLFFENVDIAEDNIVAFRASVEDKLISQVSKSGIADCIGGATGFHFSYIDLIIYDYEAFMSIAKEIFASYDFDEVGFSYFKTNSKPIMFGDKTLK